MINGFTDNLGGFNENDENSPKARTEEGIPYKRSNCEAITVKDVFGKPLIIIHNCSCFAYIGVL